MKFLVTGGAGFIASHVVDALISDGHQVTVADDLSTGKQENLNSQAVFYKLDIRSGEMAEVFAKEKPEVVNHHAAQMDVRRAVREPQFDASVNVLGSLNILECARKYGARKIIYASTGGAVYGEPENLPVDESHSIAPLSPYGLTKHTFEEYLSLYRRLYGIEYTTLRYPNVYGPRQDPHGEAGVVAIFAEQMLSGERPTIFGDGTKTRDYVFISDIVAANMLVFKQNHGEVFNLGWGREISDYQIFTAVRDALGVKIEPQYGKKRPGEIDRICLNSKKIHRKLGWQPQLSLEEGVARAVEWYHKKKKAM